MVDPLFKSDDTYQLARRLLDAAAMRQQAIASNLANLETPGYRRKDLSPDFAAALRRAADTGALTSGKDVPALTPTLAEDKTARAAGPDGNTVEASTELIAMNQNSTEFNFLADIVTGSIKELRMVITGNVSGQ